MSCVYLREKVVPAIIGKGTCALPGLIALTAVYCGGSKLSCEFPIQLAILEAEPEVEDDEPSLSEYIHNGYCAGELES